MKLRVVLLACAMIALIVSAGLARNEKHVKAPLEQVNGSGVSGTVQLTQMPHGGANLVVVAQGLTPRSSYASFYYESADCSAPADLLESFTADDEGHATVHGKIDEDVDEVGSVSVRVGPGYGDLLACARIH